MLSSVQCGLKRIADRAEVVLIFPGDQPLIEPFVINRIIAAYRQTGKGIVVPVHKRKRGHPLLIDQRYIEVVKGLGKNEVLSSLLRCYKDDLYEVETNSPGILKDFDTKEDYLNEINQTK
jgi:molybdenum cofactor cytidylyltransferase